jgi:hypothetical protein
MVLARIYVIRLEHEYRTASVRANPRAPFILASINREGDSTLGTLLLFIPHRHSARN